MSSSTPAKRTIWASVGQRTFERDLHALADTGFIPASQNLRQEDWPQSNTDENIPFTVEKQLSDDIAFISAYDYGFEYVTVATVQGSRQDGLIFRLAANKGVSPRVESALRRVLSLLEGCSSKECSREYCAEAIFNIVVELNRNRILGRLASKHFKRPAHERARAPLSIRVKSCIALRSRQPTDDSRQMLANADALHVAFLRVEDNPSLLETLKTAVKAAFDLTEDGVSFPGRLQRIGFTPAELQLRAIRELSKVANYWRICSHFAHLSRSYRTHFAKLRLETVQPYNSSRALISKMKKHVHAEVQMLLYYETSQTTPWPRAFGASKEACFLCNAFVKAHGHFILSKAHRQIFPKWTVPDLPTYSAETLGRLQRALAAVHQDITKTLRLVRSKAHSHPFPAHSSLNLHKLLLPTPSITTARSSIEPVVIANSASHDIQAQDPEHAGNVSLSGTETCSVQSQHYAERDVSKSVQQSPASSQPSPVPSIYDALHEPILWDWLHVYLVLGQSPAYGSKSTANVSVAGVSEPLTLVAAVKTHTFDVEQLAPGEEVVFSRIEGSDSGTTCAQMDIVVTKEGRKPVSLKCRW